MRQFIGYIFLLMLTFACIQHSDKEPTVYTDIPEQPEIAVKYAQGFEVEYVEGGIKLMTHSFGGNNPFSDSVYIITNSDLANTNTAISKADKKIGASANRLACQSSTYLAYLNELNSLNLVSGLCGLQYVNNADVVAVLNENQVKELCLTDEVQMEALHQTNPDLFLIYPFGDEKSKGYTENGIQTLLIAEYLEESQLARLEWIKVFGLLTGKVKEANAYFEKIESEYLALVDQQKKRDKTFIMNLPFQDEWFMPSTASVGVQLIEDAGLDYFYANEVGTENQLHSKEEVWQDGISADYWIIIARRPETFNLEDLLNEEPVYGVFKAVKEGQVIFCNTAETDYFAQGVIEPNIILKDLLFATGQIEAHQPRYFFLLD